MLNGCTVPRVNVVEVVFATRQPSLTLFLLVWDDEVVRFTIVSLVREKTLTSVKPWTVVAEDADIRSHTEMRTTEEDDVASVVAYPLHLSKKVQNNIDKYRYNR